MNPEYRNTEQEEVLRLRLSHVEMQRDALASALRKEVREIIKEVISEEIRRALGSHDQVRHRID